MKNGQSKIRASGTYLPWAMFICLVCALAPALAHARTQEEGICEQAAHFAAQRTGIPEIVLRAITLAETGRKSSGQFLPWPWTVNMEGKGQWFANRDDALKFIGANYARGARSFDVGCFQLNYKWHGRAFSSVDQMFDPGKNALYAARYLLELFQEKGNWAEAAGAYHSRTPKYANRYQRRFEKIFARLSSLPASLPAPAPKQTSSTLLTSIRVNRFPLLQRSGTIGRLGSLVPSSAGAGSLPLFGGTQ